MSTPPPTSRPPRLLLGAWLLLACAPVVYMAVLWAAYTRNIVFWDEFDTALDLLIRLHDGAGWRETVARLFALNNEHRTFTSRLLFALSYWFTGTINFHVIGAIGNLFQVATCGLLIWAVGGVARRVRLAVLLGFLMFQLEHFESFLWSGASIDHFQVVTLGVGAIIGLARHTRGGFAAALLCGGLATFTLAQGTVVWPVGALLLWQAGRRKALAWWIVGAGIAVLGFVQGFHFNPEHRADLWSFAHLLKAGRYFLALLGAPLTLGAAAPGVIAGVFLLLGISLAAARGALRREPVAAYTALFAIGALALVAVGRSELASPAVNSRYLVLGALAWAMLAFVFLEWTAAAWPAHPFRGLAAVTPALVGLLVAAHVKFLPQANGYLEVRERAATSFMQYGEDGRGIVRLHPQEKHADILMRMAEERGLYRLPSVSHPATFAAPQSSTRIITHLDELVAGPRAVTAGGWAMIRGVRSQRGQIYLVLRSARTTLYFSTVTLQRPDVAKAYNEPGWHFSGFRAVIERERLPAEDFDVGVLLVVDGKAEYQMTPNRFVLSGSEPAAVRLKPDAP